MALGSPEWGWDSFEPYFRDLETDQDYPDPPHGSSGPVPITRFKDEELIPIQRAFRDGCRTVGLADLADFNNSDNEGVGPWPMNRIETTRISAATAFLDEARSRPNLAIRQNTLVNRVVLDGKRAVAVELSDGELLEAEKIVLSAGAFGSSRSSGSRVEDVLIDNGHRPPTPRAVSQHGADRQAAIRPR